MALTPLPPGMIGAASFDTDGSTAPTRRHWLERRWDGATEADPFACWVCMNPSGAGADRNDPTVKRIVSFTKRFELRRFFLVNMGDWIETESKKLLTPGVVPCSDTNLATVLDFARRAAVVVVGYGDCPKNLRPLARHTINVLRDAEIELYCLGVTKSRDPKHPLYLWEHTLFTEYLETPDA